MRGTLYGNPEMGNLEITLHAPKGVPTCPLCGEAMKRASKGWRCDCVLPLVFVPAGTEAGDGKAPSSQGK